MARTPAEVVELASSAGTLGELCARQSVCRACDRLVAWREKVAVERRKAFEDEQYWGRPIPGWGDPDPKLLIVGLAPAANGGNRTGRIFTGDPSADWLFASLHRVGLAARPDSVRAGDGQRLLGARMLPAVRCAPPDNKPTPAERDACRPWLSRELSFVRPRVIVVLGAFGWQALWPAFTALGVEVPRPRPKFGHGAEATVGGMLLMGCFHPSPHNTYTGRVTAAMYDELFTRAKAAAGL
ncbi:uracil-DNA glycosylase [Actinocorallia longicatena]|uniref:Type-5 uracil-DNA glycosylase n=1 Tax=Actinocorallia longicatena TaxID=111803 RepID=A0ABP6Q2M3_9ACTN